MVSLICVARKIDFYSLTQIKGLRPLFFNFIYWHYSLFLISSFEKEFIYVKKIFVLLFISIFLLPFSINVSAGIISKGVKGVVAAKAVKAISNKVKDTKKPLVKRELEVGTYGKQRKKPENNLDYHHIPSVKQIEKYGIKKNDGISIGFQHDRHGITRTYKNGNKKILKDNENMRDSLARDVKDMRKIYRDNGLYNEKTRNSLKEVIKKNKESFSKHYEKVKK